MKNIKGLLETSFVDWPGKICAVMFLANCNFRCPFCHNHPLVLDYNSLESIDFEAIINRLARLKKWLGGVCISGGEPTLNHDLPAALKRLKQEGWAIKLDTNGSRPAVLEQLLADRLLDMVSMDVKAPLVTEKYNRCAGTKVNLEHIKASISLLHESGIPHEFRMTILPLFHTETDIINWARQLGKGPENNLSRLKLQNFNPASTLNHKLSLEDPFAADTFSKLQQLVA